MAFALLIMMMVFPLLPHPSVQGAGGSLAPMTVQVLDTNDRRVPAVGFYVLDEQGHLFTGINTGVKGVVAVTLPPGTYWLQPTEIPIGSGIVPHLRHADQRGIPVAHGETALLVTIRMHPDGMLVPRTQQFDPAGATAIARIAPEQHAGGAPAAFLGSSATRTPALTAPAVIRVPTTEPSGRSSDARRHERGAAVGWGTVVALVVAPVILAGLLWGVQYIRRTA